MCLGVAVRWMSDREVGGRRCWGFGSTAADGRGGTQLLALEQRHVFRLWEPYRTEGPAGLISKRRRRSSNRRKPAAVRTMALSIIRCDCG